MWLLLCLGLVAPSFLFWLVSKNSFSAVWPQLPSKNVRLFEMTKPQYVFLVPEMGHFCIYLSSHIGDKNKSNIFELKLVCSSFYLLVIALDILRLERYLSMQCNDNVVHLHLGPCTLQPAKPGWFCQHGAYRRGFKKGRKLIWWRWSLWLFF